MTGETDDRHTDPRIVSVNIGSIREIEHNGRTVTTGIFKTPTTAPQLVRGIHVGADVQADTIAHGGDHKAVYSYAAEDYEWWADRLGRPLPPGTFGENLTTAGIDVSGARVGDRWRIGAVILEVSEPRIPCFKLDIAVGERAFQRTFGAANRPGAYLRIIEEGTLRTGDGIDVTPTTEPSISVAEINDIFHHKGEGADRLLEISALSGAWRSWAADKGAR